LAGIRVLIRFDMPLGIDPAHTKTLISVEPIVPEIQAMLDQHRPRESVVANAVASHPGITQWHSEEKDCRQNDFVFADLAQTRRFAG
jgi:hypothetical protein